MRTIKVKVRHATPLPMTGFQTRCCEKDAEELGHTGHARISQRYQWVRCPYCRSEGWAGDRGYVPEPSMPLRMPWEST